MTLYLHIRSLAVQLMFHILFLITVKTFFMRPEYLRLSLKTDEYFLQYLAPHFSIFYNDNLCLLLIIKLSFRAPYSSPVSCLPWSFSPGLIHHHQLLLPNPILLPHPSHQESRSELFLEPAWC